MFVVLKCKTKNIIMSKNYNPQKHKRKSIRLKGYDYSQAGLYFVTIDVKGLTCLFGAVENGIMHLNEAGKMIDREWLKLPERFPNIKLHESVVMPNHFHGIIEILDVWKTSDNKWLMSGDNFKVLTNKEEMQVLVQTQNLQQTKKTPMKKRLGDIVGAFQSITTVEYIRGVKNFGWKRFNGKLWHRNYWEHIIRSHPSYLNISNYTMNNPAKWKEDRFFREK